MPPFKLDAVYSPTADQPKAIDGIVEGVESGARGVTLLGATGTGKTMTMAATIERLQRPALVLAHNKTLAAQLCNEFRTYFPSNAVEYFVSYYDYYQPEAYVPSKDLYIEKDSAINQEIDRLRHAATAALFARRDVVIVASVSAIFGLGSPETYNDNCQILLKGGDVDRDELLRKLVYLQYNRNDTALGRGTFRVRGDTLEVFPAYAETAFRALLFGDEVERLQHFDPLTGELIVDDLEHVAIWPATHYNVKEGTMERAVEEIGRELNHRTAELEAEGKLLESHRLRQRTQYDMEMLREVGFCSGIENYSRILDGRPPGARPYCLIDYFPEGLRLLPRRVAPDGAAARRHVRGRPLAQDDARRLRLPAAERARQPAADVRRVPLDHAAARVRVRDPGAVRARALGHDRRADRAADRDRRPRGRGARDAQPDRRPDARDPRAHRAQRARAGHDAHEEDERGPDGLPARDGLQGPLPALGGRHAGADPDHPRAAARRVRRAGRRQPAARGARPARGLAGRDPRRRQGGLPARRDLADPDDRARRPQRRRHGPDVRRQADRGDAQGDRRDRPPARDPGRVQPRARHHARRRSSRASPTSRSS